MTLRTLPGLTALQAPDGIEWTVPGPALDAYQPEIHAAADGERSISIYGVIGRSYYSDEPDNTDRRIAGALRSLGPGDITVQLNSPGGDFLHGAAIYNLLREHDGNVTVKIMALAGSAASVIAMAGDEILIPRAGFVFVHDASAIAIGNRYLTAAVTELLAEIDASMADVYAARAGVTTTVAAGWMDKSEGKGTMFRGEAAIKAGLADAILSEDQIGARAETPAPQQTKAVARLENVLAAAGMSRDERRSLIGDAIGSRAVAGDLDPSDAVARLATAAGLGRLIADIKSGI